MYDVQDEDDPNRTMNLPAQRVKRLEDTTTHLRKGDKVLAVFPDTTSFYRAQIVKTPKPPGHGNSNWEVVVRFEDDEDESGKAPARRVPGRFVLLRKDVDPEDGEEEEEEEEEEGGEND
jgi:SGF29 tudor-like domain